MKKTSSSSCQMNSNLQIHNKLSISSLLADTKAIDDNIIKDIRSIHERVLSIYNNLQSFKGVNIRETYRAVSEIHSDTLKLKKYSFSQLSECDKLLADVERVTILIISLLREMKNVNQATASCDAATRYLREGTTFKFNVVTQKMMRDSGSSIYKRKRLGRQKVDLLDEWYNEHSSRPYLTEDTLRGLTTQTGLSKGQIRNWISNKRRKERLSAVSDEISALLLEIDDGDDRTYVVQSYEGD